MLNKKYKLYYFNQVLHLETNKKFDSIEDIKKYLLSKRVKSKYQYVIVDCTETYNSKIVMIEDIKDPFESIGNYLNAVWNENLSDRYTGQSYGYNKFVILGNKEFFEEQRLAGISPYEAMLMFNEIETNKK